VQRRNLTTEIARGAARVMALPFLLFRRSARSLGERSQSARRAHFDTCCEN
jgi:hypothetical protein